MFLRFIYFTGVYFEVVKSLVKILGKVLEKKNIFT